MKTVLYATDLSKHEVYTLRYAYKLSNGLKANLIVLHIYSVPPVTVATIRSAKQIKERLNIEKRDTVLNYCVKHLKDESVRDRVEIKVHEHAAVSDGILEKTRDLNPDLVLVGMKDEHTQRGLFTGNIAKKLMKKVGCALLIVPNTLRFRKLQTIIYATDFEEADIFAIKKLVELAKPFKAKIRVVHIPTIDEYVGKEQLEGFEAMVRKKVNYSGIHFHTFLANTIYHGLRAFVELHDADMLVMMERKHEGPFFKKLFHKDLVKHMESHISIPLLSFNKANL
ncbi:universal stress protein [Maribacter halichondriae]|uniref:universal stress protein n=1 Tax=Maribacter halichondriae TaxID=2980554 RepID=UPI0023592BF7|nr:universal stress protein [Maribacter sp. Hal144]